jgi:hypothetical protein
MRITREPIEESRLCGRHKTLGLVLPVDLDQRATELCEGRSGRELPADACAALPVSVDRAGYRTSPSSDHSTAPSMASNRA